MNIQIYGKSKCFDTKKAQRYFKERKIKFQDIDILKFGLSPGEYKSVKAALGGNFYKLMDSESKAYQDCFIEHLATDEAREGKFMENFALYKTPIVRNGRKATIGYQPEIWKKWLET
ncbi:MAG: ArsC family transcriptional regulator [Defluviitaleaceae bacterium]|nr:ArsC family transcriptional regulator [Defluviitaleaceae bacterium]